ncbi:AraC family transcriptional regulator [Paenibacillus filicis]|uniref:AraC family transcriptional regulator n=1 Tax=Paenibacillus filicis TaxID=669464 RepID=A0ABU9DIM9_9BACL
MIYSTSLGAGKMQRDELLRERMSMPDHSFPIKLFRFTCQEEGFIIFHPHWHEQIELLYIVSGSARIECSSVPYEAKAGDVIVVNSNELHYGVCTSRDLVYYVVIFHPALLQSSNADAVETKFMIPISQNRLLFLNHIAGDKRFSRCVEEITYEIEHKQEGYELAIKSDLYKLMTLLVRRYIASSSDLEGYRLRLKHLEHLAPALRYMELHSHESLTVEQLADLANMSRSHFSRLFKKLTEKTLTEYIHFLRINRAAELLRTTQMSISEIALLIGYNDIYYFSRTFKKLKGASPTNWRDISPDWPHSAAAIHSDMEEAATDGSPA